MTEITEIYDIVGLNKFMGLSAPVNKDFEVCRLEDIPQDNVGEVAPFRHRLFSVCLVSQLDMELNIGYYKRQPKASFLLFKSPYQVMSWQLQSGIKKGWHFLMSQDFLLKYPQLTNIIYEFPFLQLDKAIPFEISEKDASKLFDIFEKTNEEYLSENSDRFDLIASYVHVMLVHIRRLYEKSLETEKELITMVKESDLILFNRLKEFLDKQTESNDTLPENGRTVGYAAENLAVHPNYLNAVVKRITGNTATNFIQEHTISTAKTLLLHTGLSIKEISFKLSFNEPTHFSTFFKKHTGLTPAEFRKESHL